MIATTEEALGELFTDAMIAIVPRVTFKEGETWKPYSREVAGPSRTRRFRLLFEDPQLYVRVGAMAGHVFEHTVVLAVRTDYCGDHAKMQFAIMDDTLQLRDVLSGLSATDNGVQRVAPITYRTRKSYSPTADLTQVDHFYTVYYMRSIRP